MAQIIKGIDVATSIKNRIVEKMQSEDCIIPCLATVRLGERADDIAYERGLTKNLSNLNYKIKNIVLDKEISENELVDVITKLNNDKEVHGILVFRPLPKHINTDNIINLIAPEKDIDCMNPLNMAKLTMSDATGYAPCTAKAVIEILDYMKCDIKGKRTVVIGRSLVVGKPLGLMLLDCDATVTWCHSKTKDIPKMCEGADVIVVAVGRPYFLKKEHVINADKDVIVIDVGINAKPNGEDGICGDVDFDDVVDYVGTITKVPGGVGSVTNAVLAKQLFIAANKSF